MPAGGIQIVGPLVGMVMVVSIHGDFFPQKDRVCVIWK